MRATATIIGGGIGGLAVANALQQVGIDFRVYEQAPALTEVGAAIGLSHGALRVLDALGLGEEALAASTEVASMYFADRNLQIRRRMPRTFTGRCIHRAELIKLLRARLPEHRIHLSLKAVAAESLADCAEVLFEDGTRVASTYVIAADGINSAIRRGVFPEVRTRPINQTIWRGITNATMPDELREAYIEIWSGGLRFLTAPLAPSRTCWLAVKRAPPGGEDNSVTLRADLCDLFADYSPVVRSLIRASEGPIIRNDMADLGPPRQGWHRDRVVFLGDAIHATTPNLAQGGCQAMESALCLALCLDNYDDYAEAFENYYRLRRKKVYFVVRTSWSFGRAAHSFNPLLHYGYRTALEHAPEWLLERQARFVYDLSYLKNIDRRQLIAV